MMYSTSLRNGTLAALLVMTLALLFGCVHTGQTLLEQKNKISLIPSEWRSKSAILLDSLTEVVFEEHRSGNKVRTKEVLWVYVNHRNPNRWEDKVFYDQGFFEEPAKIEAAVYYPDGKKWYLEQNQVKRHKINFSSVHLNHFRVPEYDKGILLRLEISRVYFHPEFKSTFVLRHHEPVLNRKIQLIYPASCQLTYGLENAEKADVDMVTTTEKGLRKVTITATNLPGSLNKWETEYPEQWYAALHVSFPPKGNRSYSWQELGDHYLDLAKDAFKVSSAIKDFSASVKAKAQTDEGVLAGAFHALVNKVRYHGDEEGRFAVFPRKAETIMANGYGDCKELSTLLHTLLKTKKMKSWLSMVSTWKNYQPLSKYPSLNDFNHVVLACPNTDGQLHFLDGTQSLANAKNSYYHLIGRTAFVLEPGNSRLVEITKKDDFKSLVTTKSKIVQDRDAGRWLIKGDIKLQGYPALRFYKYLNYSDSVDKTMLARRFVQSRFGILPLQIEFKAPTCDNIMITYKAAFQSNFINLGNGGFKLSLPRLYKTDVDEDLVDKSGPVFLEPFEQQDTWILPSPPGKKQLYRYKLPFANQRWRAKGKVISRYYSQAAKHFKIDDDNLNTWTKDCKRAGDNLVWE